MNDKFGRLRLKIPIHVTQRRKILLLDHVFGKSDMDVDKRWMMKITSHVFPISMPFPFFQQSQGIRCLTDNSKQKSKKLK